jgi:hypothetical protein
MCGRFTQSYTWRELVELYRLTQPARNLRPRYNIAPSTAVDVVRLAETGPEVVLMRCPLGDRYQGHKSCRMQLRAIIRKSLQLRYTAALIKIAHLSDALNVACCKCAQNSYRNS